ncbi:MAG TPA: HAMP domain-containing sensor histidine kinase [Cyclobacteriaceae bacterium]|nr:HAMP domain-containing sensor histidine kinase [Cyclobacteriaceae bacterium]
MKKNWITIVLMVCSIVLLIGLQVVWLQSLFKDVKRDLRRETSFLFSSTLMAMQDSVLERNIKPLPGDSMVEIFGKQPKMRDTMRVRGNIHMEMRRDSDEPVVFFSTETPDSIKKFFRPLISKLRGNRRQRGYVMRVTSDSLKPGTIHKKYKEALLKSGLPLLFKVEKTNEHTFHRDNNSSALVTEPFPFFQRGSFYVARFSDATFFIWKKLLPQLLFSIFLTSLTAGSFYLMYRSMRFNQRLLKIKNDFIGNMTHELKTPIATVSVALESLKSFSALDNPQRTKEYIDMAQQELNRLSILTDKVLKTAIFESNGLAFQTEKVDLEKVTSRVIDSMKLVFEKNNAKVNFVREGTTFFVNGNEDHLTNVIYNLLDNALKYSNGDPSIEVAMKVSGDNIVFSVSDHGIGIGPEHQKRIFEKFYRVPTGDVANIKGYGLGLSYVHSVVKMHGGEISVESSLNEGTTFVVNLPKLA